MDNQLTGRVALVTGANHGIGAATEEALARFGARVFVTYLRLTEPRRAPGEWCRSYDEVRATASDEVVARIRADGGQADSVEADLADADVPADLFKHAEDALGPVEILVNNADHCSSDTFLPASNAHGSSAGGETMRTLTPESFDAHAAVNARAPALKHAADEVPHRRWRLLERLPEISARRSQEPMGNQDPGPRQKVYMFAANN